MTRPQPMGQVRPPPGAEALRRLVAGRLALAERRATLVGAVYERRTRHAQFLDAGDEG